MQFHDLNLSNSGPFVNQKRFLGFKMVVVPLDAAMHMQPLFDWMQNTWKNSLDLLKPLASTTIPIPPTKTKDSPFSDFIPLFSWYSKTERNSFTNELNFEKLSKTLSASNVFVQEIRARTGRNVLPLHVNLGILMIVFLGIVYLRQFWIRSKVSFRHHHCPSVIARSNEQGNAIEEIRLDQLVWENCPKLTKGYYYPTPWMSNGHIQTIYAALTSQYYKPKVIYQRVLLTAADGGQISVDWDTSRKLVKGSKQPIMLLLHGLTGGSHESYVQSMITSLQPHGFISVVFNFRGCAGSEVLTPQLYSASFTSDLDLVIKHILSVAGEDTPLFGCGYSLGANILLKYAGETGDHCPFSGLLSIANPFDLTATNTELHSGIFKRTLYSWRLASNLIRVLRRFGMHSTVSSTDISTSLKKVQSTI